MSTQKKPMDFSSLVLNHDGYIWGKDATSPNTMLCLKCNTTWKLSDHKDCPGCNLLNLPKGETQPIDRRNTC